MKLPSKISSPGSVYAARACLVYVRGETAYPRLRCRTTTTADSPPERARANIHTVRSLKSPVWGGWLGFWGGADVGAGVGVGVGLGALGSAAPQAVHTPLT